MVMFLARIQTLGLRVPPADYTYSVHFRGLCTGALDQESQGYQLGLLSRRTVGCTGEGPRNEHERRGWIYCPLKPVRTGKHSPKWTYELMCLRRGVRRLFNKCRADRTPHSRQLYREAQRIYRKEVRKASKYVWRTFCNSVNDLMSARLHSALSMDPKMNLGSLVTLRLGIRHPKGKS